MTYLSIPFAVALTEESSWAALDPARTSFSIVRFHFKLDDRSLGEPHKVGDTIGVYQKPKGITTKHVKSEEIEIEQIVSLKSIENHLLQSEVVAEIAAELASKSGLNSLLSFDTALKSKVSQKLSSSYTIGVELSATERVTRKETLVIENQIPADIDASIVSVPVYKRRAIDVTLAYVDFLRVDYARSTFGLRKKSRKQPPVTHPHKHANRIKFGCSIATAYYWELLPKSSKFMFERDHKLEVADPLQISIGEPRLRNESFVEFPKVATLYQIANAAFPHKWIWRRSKRHEWTAEELLKIEEEEIRDTPLWQRMFGDRG